MIDYTRLNTFEQLIEKYDLENLKKDRKRIKVIKDALDSSNTIIKNFVKAVTKDVTGLEDVINVWFGDVEPTNSNFPVSEWSDKSTHVKDLYYNRQTGRVYRYSSSYTWLEITERDVVESLALANSELDASDGLRRVFLKEPSPPYEVGDVWYDENKDIYRCRASRSEGDYNQVDWILASLYSNDDYIKKVEAVLDQFKENVIANYVTKVLLETTKNSIIGRVESISTNVDGRIEEMSSELSLYDNKIAMKLNASSFTKAAIIGLINQNGTSTAKIEADNINLNGKTINLTSDNISIESNNFEVDTQGNTTMSNANITGGRIWLHPVSGNNTPYYGEIIVGEIAIPGNVATSDKFVGITNSNIYMKQGNSNQTILIQPDWIYCGGDSQGAFSFRPNSINLTKGERKITSVVNDTDIYIKVEKSDEFSQIQTNGVWAPAFNNNSLESKKKNITLDHGCLEQILNTDIVNFNWNFEDDDDKKHIGLVIPDLGGNYKYAEKALTHDRDAVDLYSMVGMSWKAIQELYSIIKLQAEKIEELEAMLNGTAKSN